MAESGRGKYTATYVKLDAAQQQMQQIGQDRSRMWLCQWKKGRMKHRRYETAVRLEREVEFPQISDKAEWEEEVERVEERKSKSSISSGGHRYCNRWRINEMHHKGIWLGDK